MKRRTFLSNSITTTVAVGLGPALLDAANATQTREFYEVRTYRIPDAARQEIVLRYLEKGLLPALNRMAIDPIGVFTPLDGSGDFSIQAIIPYRELARFTELHPRLAKDHAYLEAAGESFAQPQSHPAYTRMDSWFLKAFSGMPVMELPPQTRARKPRIFELRTYESHNEDAARRKVEMFNSGEMQIMRDVKLAPVLYGEMLIGSDGPHLTYMLSGDDMESHKAHWKAFFAHPEWNRIKKLPKNAGTVSKVRNVFLQPTSFSQI